MDLDAKTLVLVLALINVVLLVAIYVQFRVNSKYHGLNWWLLGIGCMAAGFLLMPLVSVKQALYIVIFANPLVEVGLVFLYVGIERYLERPVPKKLLTVLYIAFFVMYLFFAFGFNSWTARSIVVSIFVIVICSKSAFSLYRYKNNYIKESANFTALIFGLYSLYFIIRTVALCLVPPINSYNDHSFLYLSAYIVPLIAGTLWTFGFVIMVNQRLNGEIEEEKEKLHMIFNTSPDAELITRLYDGVFVDVNEGFTQMTGYKKEEVIGHSILEIDIWYPSTERERFVEVLKKNNSCMNMEFEFKRKDQTFFSGMLSARTIMLNGQLHIVTVVKDITVRKLTEAAVRESEALYKSILNASPDDITITDLAGNIVMLSQAANKHFGYEANVVGDGRNLLEFIVPEDVERAKENIQKMVQGINQGPNEYRGIRQDGSIFDIEVNSGLIRGVYGQPTKMVFIVRNISERKIAEQQIQVLISQIETERNIAQINSITDSLTGLSNRRYFDKMLATEFYRLKRSGAPLSLIMLDVDFFKNYNDHYGHVAGDDCLKQIGTVLTMMGSRLPDIVARYGGEEFIIILPETEDYGAATLAEHIRIEIENLHIVHEYSKVASVITVSLGVVTTKVTGFSKPEEVLKQVDFAMYQAKQNGRNQVYIAKLS